MSRPPPRGFPLSSNPLSSDSSISLRAIPDSPIGSLSREPNPRYIRQQNYAQQYPIPQGADVQLWNLFVSVSNERSGTITSRELQQALYNAHGDVFDLDNGSIHHLMSTFDSDHSGTLSFNEFSGLCGYIAQWRSVFYHFDTNMSGSIERDELQNAMNSHRYQLSPKTITILMHKFAPPPTSGSSQRSDILNFVGFMMACVTVQTLTEKHRAGSTLPPSENQWARMDYDEFIQTSLNFL